MKLREWIKTANMVIFEVKMYVGQQGGEARDMPKMSVMIWKRPIREGLRRDVVEFIF